MRARIGKLVALATLAVACGGQTVSESAPGVESAAHHDISPPLFLMPPAPRQAPTEHEVKRIPRNFNRTPAAEPMSASRSALTVAAPALSVSFEGVGNGFSGPQGPFTVTSAPPDTNGDVGPNHYVQTVNTDYAVFSKTGAPLFGPVPINTLWSGFGGLCQSDNDGDPLVIYDPIADRWVISQFAVTGANGTSTPFLQCVAVSTTGDPKGAFARYSFPYTGFPDYPKMGVWPDAYYITFNFFNAAGTSFLGSRLCAYDRGRMLSALSATQQCFQTSTSFGGVLPADLDGATPPPAGSPNYMVALGATSPALAWWTFHVDWTTPASTTLSGPFTITAQPYAEACAGGACVPQAGTSQQLDSLADRLMYRLAYRNRGGTESLVFNHSVTAGAATGVRWYELRASAGSLSLFQQGTYAPDALYRWMGSAAMDQAGNIALGFSVSSSGTKPALHYTGRLAGDPAGTMTQGEGTLIDGAGSQLAKLNRWGDYSMLGVDPVDDCTFWFTSEYLTASGTFNWHTRIGSFVLPGCGTAPPANDFSIGASPSSVSVTQGGSADTALSTTLANGTAETVAFSASGLPAGAGATFNPASTLAGNGSTLTLATSASTPAGSYPITVTGTAPSATHSTTVTLAVSAPVVPDFSVSIAPSSRSIKRGRSTSYTVTLTPSGGFAGAVALAVSGLGAGATGSFSPNPAVSTSTLTVATVASAARGGYTVTVTGTSRSLSRTATANLQVR